MTTTYADAIVPVPDAPKSAASFDELRAMLDSDLVGNGVDMANGFVQADDLFDPVMIRLMPGKAIPEEVDRDHDIIGVVLSCEAASLSLFIGGEDPVKLNSSDDFVIPAGVHYSLQNNSTTQEALVKFLINL